MRRRSRHKLSASAAGVDRPLGSVWLGEDDAELIARMLSFYPRAEFRLILDAMVSSGRFWRGSMRSAPALLPDHLPQFDRCE